MELYIFIFPFIFEHFKDIWNNLDEKLRPL